MSEQSGVPVAEFKRDFARYAATVERGETVVVTRHGKAIGAFVPAHAVSASALPKPKQPGGLLAFMGLLDDWDTIDADLATVMRGRRRERVRAVPPPG